MHMDAIRWYCSKFLIRAGQSSHSCGQSAVLASGSCGTREADGVDDIAQNGIFIITV